MNYDQKLVPAALVVMPLREARQAFERTYFAHHLVATNGNMLEVARRTGMGCPSGLRRKLRQIGLFPWCRVSQTSGEERACATGAQTRGEEVLEAPTGT